MGTKYLFIFLFLVTNSRAGPLNSEKNRWKTDKENINANNTGELNGCVLDNIEYKPGDEVPSLGPCERCICNAPDVICSMIKCQPNSGCRIIQQSGQCCPEYKCDCEHNGKIYNNGERLDKPEDPCQVCYCKGGEIMCTSITCYERDDCKPHFSPGQCCPRYDHCPVETGRVSVNSVRSVNASLYSPKREMQPWPLTKPSSVPSSVNYDEANSAHNNVYPQTIKIVEILPTTPGFVNKPSEVSVIPRLKTNDQESKNREVESIEGETVYPSLTSETMDSSTILSSSTSEIEHLLDTTPEIDVKNSEQKIEAAPERSVSTLNPLSEDILLTNSPLPQPDSYKFSTMFPNYYYSEGELNNLGEATTAESVTEVEGSGYELLTGGIYEDISSESSSSGDIQSTTDTDHAYTDTTQSSEEISNKTHDSPKFEAYTATESYSGESNSSYSTNITNNESSESDSSEQSSEEKSELHRAPYNNSETLGEYNSDENLSELIKLENTTSSSESTTDGMYSLSPENVQASDLHLSTSNIENSSEALYEKSTFSSELPTEPTTEVLSSESIADSNTNRGFTHDYSSASLLDNENETSTQQYEASEIDESITDYDGLYTVANDRPSLLVPEGRKKSSRLTFDESEVESKSPSSIIFPSVLNVHSLEYNQMNPQTETVQSENVTSMAQVEIYHPAKPNELAGVLTVVDEKTNASGTDGKIISSHILLTPNDLKKLAEILIHEKIKPASPDDSKIKNANTEVSPDELGISSSENLTANNKAWKSKSEVGATYNDSEETESSSDSGSNISKDEVFRNFISSTLPSNKVLKDSNLEDPNTSRQIRIPDNGSQQYSALLDDRDLLILENFFRKNIGLQ